MPVYRTLILSLSLLSGFTITASALQEQPQSGKNLQERRLLQVAQQSATIAGGARYCKLDVDDIEEFIGKADARITLMARDDYQKVLGRLEFKNILAASSVREPVEGCEKLAIKFGIMLRESR